jgi:hypothetical protein
MKASWKRPQPKKKRHAFLDSLMNIYDRRIKYFNQKGFVMGRKATLWLRYNLPPPADISNEDLAAIYRKGYDMLEISIRSKVLKLKYLYWFADADLTLLVQFRKDHQRRCG